MPDVVVIPIATGARWRRTLRCVFVNGALLLFLFLFLLFLFLELVRC